MKIKLLIFIVTNLFCVSVLAQEILADTDMIEFGSDLPQYDYSSKDTKPKDKISHYGEGIYVREYNDFGKPMVEIHPDRGPNYYFSEETLRKPSPEDGVRFRDTPNWMVSEW